MGCCAYPNSFPSLKFFAELSFKKATKNSITLSNYLTSKNKKKHNREFIPSALDIIRLIFRFNSDHCAVDKSLTRFGQILFSAIIIAHFQRFVNVKFARYLAFFFVEMNIY